MPQTVCLQPGHGANASEISRMLHPSSLIRYKWMKTWQREGVKEMLLVKKYFWVVRRGSPATDAFIMCHEYFPNKVLYAIKMMVHIKEEGPEEDLFDLERPSLDSYIASAVVPPEEGVERFREK